MCTKNNAALVASKIEEIRIILLDICSFLQGERVGILNRLQFKKKVGNRNIYEFANSNDKLSIAFDDIAEPNNLNTNSSTLEAICNTFLRSFKECDETQAQGEQCYSDNVIDKINKIKEFANFAKFDIATSRLFEKYFGGRTLNIPFGINLGLGSAGSALSVPVGNTDVDSLKDFVKAVDRACQETIALTYDIPDDTISCSEKDNDKLPENQPEPEPEPEPEPPTDDICIDINNSLKLIAEKEFNITGAECDLQPVIDALKSTETNILNAIANLDLTCPEIEIPQVDLTSILTAIQNTQDYLDNRIITVEQALQIISDLSTRIKSDTQGIYNDTQYLRNCPCNDDVVDRLTDIINNLEQADINLDELKNYITNEHNETRNLLNPDINGEIMLEGCPDNENFSNAYFEALANNWSQSLINQGIEAEVKALKTFFETRLKLNFGRVFNEFLGFNTSFSGQGVIGLSSQIAALSRQTATINQQLCLNPEKLQLPEQIIPSQECEVIVIEPFEKYAEFERVTQLAITYIPEGEKRTAKTSRWSLNIPNPISEIDWCRDIEPLVWHKGDISLRIYWDNSKVWSGGYFNSENTINDIIPKITRLSQSTPTNIRISKGGSPKATYRNVTIVPVVASVVSYDENSNKTGLICYKKPPNGC